MVFSSLTFLFIFLPVVLIGNAVLPKKCINAFLLLMSLIFYAWGEPKYIILMLISIAVNWIFGMLIEDKSDHKKLLLVLDIIFNLSLLAYFKYLDFFITTINTLVRGNIPLRNIALPIGISFYTFQILSYIIDLYYGEYKAQRNIMDLGLYISLFPQLIAGPIVRYTDIKEYLTNRTCTPEKTAEGVRRFIYGLAKKVIIANTVAECFKDILAIQSGSLGPGVAWMGVLLCMINMYYDFSGYSDMAIGIGKMLGFDFNENFNYPYLSRSVTEYWQRWHISLGVWLREYVMVPFTMSSFTRSVVKRVKNKKIRRNLRSVLGILAVFFVSGIWHGAGMGFIVWGLYNGLLMVIEFLGFEKFLKKHKFLSHVYLLLAVGLGLIVFEDGISRGLPYIRTLFTPWISPANGIYSFREIVDTRVIVFTVFGVMGAGFLKPLTDKLKESAIAVKGEMIWCAFLLITSIMLLAGGTYNPFIYFRF